MKAVQVPKVGADFEIVEREIPQPGAGHVRIHVQACGICHSDVITKEGLFPGITYLRVPSYAGGYQEYMVAPVEALAQMPESLDAAEAAPLMCAGVTTFNSLRHSGALPSAS